MKELVLKGSKRQNSKRSLWRVFYFLFQHSSIEDTMLMKMFMIYKLKTFYVTVKKILWKNYNCLVHSMCIYVQHANADQK